MLTPIFGVARIGNGCPQKWSHTARNLPLPERSIEQIKMQIAFSAAGKLIMFLNHRCLLWELTLLKVGIKTKGLVFFFKGGS